MQAAGGCGGRDLEGEAASGRKLHGRKGKLAEIGARQGRGMMEEVGNDARGK